MKPAYRGNFQPAVPLAILPAAGTFRASGEARQTGGEAGGRENMPATCGAVVYQEFTRGGFAMRRENRASAWLVHAVPG